MEEMNCEHRVKTDMTSGRVKVQRGTQLTTPNPLLSHSYLHKHCNTSHTELITSNIYSFQRISVPTVPSISRYTRRLSSPSPCQKQIERNYCTTNMACIEELDHKDCIGLHSTNPPHTQCHRNRWLNKDCWISQSDRRLGNNCLFFLCVIWKTRIS